MLCYPTVCLLPTPCARFKLHHYLLLGSINNVACSKFKTVYCSCLQHRSNRILASRMVPTANWSCPLHGSNCLLPYCIFSIAQLSTAQFQLMVAYCIVPPAWLPTAWIQIHYAYCMVPLQLPNALSRTALCPIRNCQ